MDIALGDDLQTLSPHIGLSRLFWHYSQPRCSIHWYNHGWVQGFQVG